MKQLPISYKKELPLVVLSDNPLTFLHLGKLFANFSIITTNRREWHNSGLTDATMVILPLKGSGSPSSIIRSARLAEYAKQHPKSHYLTYSPIDPPYKINPLSLLMNSPTLTHAYENKRYFRDEFSDSIRMPEYTVMHLNQLDKAAAYKELKNDLGPVIVLQDEESSGSKGTFIVKTYDEYASAVSTLRKNAKGRSVVISKHIEGLNASVQVCITKHGIFSGGIQYQIIADKELCNPDLDGATAWCGGEVGANVPDLLQLQAHEMATIVGNELASHGYKGIFGIDLIVTPDHEVYAIEINARLTGYSHIISDLQMLNGKIPFTLLHILELANLEYEVTDVAALPSYANYKKPAAYMIINNPLEEEIVLKKAIPSGIYRLKGEGVEFVRQGSSLAQIKRDDEFFLFCNKEAGETIGRGKRIANITKMGPVYSNKQKLLSKNKMIIRAVKKQFKLPL